MAVPAPKAPWPVLFLKILAFATFALLATRQGVGYIRPTMDLITRTEDLAAACAKLSTAPFIAVDTEFMREQTFWPRLCLIQIAGGDTEILIDSMAPDIDLKPFFDLMVDETVLEGLSLRAPGR